MKSKLELFDKLNLRFSLLMYAIFDFLLSFCMIAEDIPERKVVTVTRTSQRSVSR